MVLKIEMKEITKDFQSKTTIFAMNKTVYAR